MINNYTSTASNNKEDVFNIYYNYFATKLFLLKQYKFHIYMSTECIYFKPKFKYNAYKNHQFKDIHVYL